MSSREMRILLAVDDQIDYDAIRSALPPGAPVVEAALAAGRPVAPDEAIDVVLVGCGDQSDHALRFIEAARVHRPEAPVVVVGTTVGGRTNAQGVYTIAGVPQGAVQLRVLRIGFQSVCP